MVCDEGHRIKNAHAGISQSLKQIKTKYVYTSLTNMYKKMQKKVLFNRHLPLIHSVITYLKKSVAVWFIFGRGKSCVSLQNLKAEIWLAVGHVDPVSHS